MIFFSLRHTLEKELIFQERIYIFLQRKKTLFAAGMILSQGDHNLENILASCCAALLMGLDPGSVAQTLRTFKGVKHRLQFVDEINGVKYVNDSKVLTRMLHKGHQRYSSQLSLSPGAKTRAVTFPSLQK